LWFDFFYYFCGKFVTLLHLGLIMARIKGGSPLGELSGKMGGFVFARNKGGAYVRQFVMPTDARSIAQLRARAQFAQAVSGYHTLTPLMKGEWQSFASQYFTSKNRGNVPGIHSGVNAFVSLRNSLLQLNHFQSAPNININSTPATLVTLQDVTLITHPPTSVLEGVLDEGKYAFGSCTELNVKFTSGVVEFSFNTIATGGGASGPSPKTGSILRDGNGQNVGFNVYLSNPLIQDGVFVQNPAMTMIASTGLINQYTTASVITTNVELVIPITLDFSGIKSGWVAGSRAEVTVYMVNAQGQQVRVYSKMDTII
jgi:hypothetical protein